MINIAITIASTENKIYKNYMKIPKVIIKDLMTFHNIDKKEAFRLYFNMLQEEMDYSQIDLEN